MKLDLARGMIRKAEAKWPGLTKYLNASELGSDPRAIRSRPILRVRPSGRLNIRVKTGHKGSKKLGVQKGCRRIVKKCLFSQELATYLLASEKVNFSGQNASST